MCLEVGVAHNCPLAPIHTLPSPPWKVAVTVDL